MVRGKSGIAGEKRRIIKEKPNLFTGVAALFILPQDSGMYGASCSLLGINRQANYAVRGLENRAAFEKFLNINRGFVPGDMVICRAGSGTLLEKPEESIKIYLKPRKFEKVYSSTDNDGIVYPPCQKERLARWEPSLDDYERDERSDTVPQEWKNDIEELNRSHNHTSPKTKDPAKRRHPQFPAQIDKKKNISLQNMGAVME